MNGLPNQRAQSTPGRSDPPVKPTSEVAHQPGQQGHDQKVCRYPTLSALCPVCARLWADMIALGLCGGVQHREIKSAGQTTGGACGGTRLGNPCDEDGLTR